METKLYNVVFKGKVFEGYEVSTVKEEILKIFKMDIKKCDILFNGKPKLIKRNIDKQKALKYKNLLKKAGAKCSITEIKLKEKQILKEKNIKECISAGNIKECIQTDNKVNCDDKVTCPNCNKEQNKVDECIFCGIIFNKFHEEKLKEKNNDINSKHDEHNDYYEEEEEEEDQNQENEQEQEVPTGIKGFLYKLLPKSWVSSYHGNDNDNDNGNGNDKKSFVIYFLKFFDNLLQLFLLLIVASAFNLLVLYVGKGFWVTYLSSPIGETFIEAFPETSNIFNEILYMDFFSLSVDLILIVFVICLSISILAQLFYLSRLFYESQGIWGRIIFWGLPLAVINAFYFNHIYDFCNWITSFIIVAIPTLIIFFGCFKFSSELVPEIGFFLKKKTI